MNEYDELKPIFIGGTGRSGTTIVSKFIGSHAEVVKIPMESRFIIDKNGLIDLFLALTDNYSLDQGRVAIRDFENKMVNELTNPYKAPYLGWNPRGEIKKTLILEATKELLNKVSRGTFMGTDYHSSDIFDLLYLVRRLLKPVNRVLGILSRVTNNKRLSILPPSVSRLKPKEGIYIPKYFTDEQELLEYLRNFLLEVFSGIFDQNKQVTAWCEDTPGNMLNLNFLQRLFPNGKYVHVMRHPVGVAYSMQHMFWAPSSLEQCCDFLTELYKRLIDIHKEFNPYNNYLFVKLENLAYDNYKKELSDFLNLDPPKYSGGIRIEPDKMNYYLEQMKPADIEYVSYRLQFAIDFFNY